MTVLWAWAAGTQRTISKEAGKNHFIILITDAVPFEKVAIYTFIECLEMRTESIVLADSFGAVPPKIFASRLNIRPSIVAGKTLYFLFATHALV